MILSQNNVTMNVSRKILLTIVMMVSIWLGAKLYMTIGAILMRQAPSWLMKETIKP